jgi:hypothetical protein
MDLGQYKERAEAEFGFVAAMQPVELMLHGQSFRPLISDGVLAGETVRDVVNFAHRWVVAAGDEKGSTGVAGRLQVMAFSPDDTWTSDGDPKWDGGRSAPIFVTPERPDLSSGWALRQLTPHMLQPLDSQHYWGELGIMTDELSAEGVARLMGVPDLVEQLKRTVVPPEFSHLRLGKQGPPVKTMLPQASLAYHSERTRMTWLTQVDIARHAHPRRTVAFSTRVAPIARSIRTTMIMDRERPVTTAPILPVVDAFADSMTSWTR